MVLMENAPTRLNENENEIKFEIKFEIEIEIEKIK
jgi:hypothetical protein